VTDTATPFTLVPLAPLASAPAPAPAASGALVPSTPVGSDWSVTKRDNEAKVRGERRSAIERARHSVEAGWSRPGQLTKAERLAQAAATRNRQAGSEDERRDTRSAVARAIAKVDGVASTIVKLFANAMATLASSSSGPNNGKKNSRLIP
jgi:hypothetical protein